MDMKSNSNFDSQNIMATLLRSLPSGSDITKIEYEGPSIALYSQNPKHLFQHSEIISGLVNSIHKRIVIRSDESIRLPEDESLKIIKKTISNKYKIESYFFDDAKGECKIYIGDYSGFVQNLGNDLLLDLLEKTGWDIIPRQSPKISTTIDLINSILKRKSSDRIRFYKEIGEKIFRSQLDDIVEASIVTLGGFSEIGRSCIFLVTHESKILLDCGINNKSTNPQNKFPRFDVLGTKISDIDAVILTHSHIDHTGFLPILFKYGYRGPIYCTEPTLVLMNLLQRNYLETNQYDGLCSEHDIENIVPNTITLNLGEVTDISPDIKMTLYNSGHILGSTSIHLHIGNGNYNLVYSGDLKFGKSNLLDNASWNYPRVETLIIESTYGGREDVFHYRNNNNDDLIRSINETLTENGVVFIPCPILGISQEISFILNNNLKLGLLQSSKIYLESSIMEAYSIYELYNEYLSKELNNSINSNNAYFFSENIKLFSEKNKNIKSGIVIFPFYMFRTLSFEYLKKMTSRKNNKLIFLSDQMYDTISTELQNGNKSVQINNNVLDIQCKVETIPGYVNHSDYNQYLAYVNRLKPKLRRIILNHGERSKIQNLTNSITKMIGIPTIRPLNAEAIRLL